MSAVKQEWVKAAADAADRVCGVIDAANMKPFVARPVPAGEADGSNSLDEGFMDELLRGDHLNDSFLRT